MKILQQAPIAVGITALSSEDMYLSAGRGKCIQIYHVMGDNLCQLGKSPVRPDLGLPNVSEEDQQSDDNENSNEKSEITKNDSDDAKPLSNLINELEIGNDDVNPDKTECVSQVSISTFLNLRIIHFRNFIIFKLKLYITYRILQMKRRNKRRAQQTQFL